MTNDTTLTLLYTGNLQGNLALLPRLYTYLKVLRGEFSPNYLLDVGSACHDDVWHCQVTQGRSMLIGLDGMGYTAANTADLEPESREKLVDQIALALVNADHPHITQNCLFSLRPVKGDGHLCIVMIPTTETRLRDYILHLKTVQAGEIGIAHIAWQPDPQLLMSEIRTLPPDTLPDATIAGVVDFIQAEARFHEKRRR